MKRQAPTRPFAALASSTARAAMLAVLLSACGSTSPTRVYDLSPVDVEAQPVGGTRVLLTYLEVPRYLDGTKIVTRSGGNELVVAEFDRWGEPVDAALGRTLVRNLSLLLPSDQVTRHSWELQGTPADYVVAAVVQRFEAEDGRAVLDARWSVATPAGDPVAHALRTYEQPVDGDDYAAIARALSEAVGDLSRDVAEAIRAAGG